MHIIRDVIARGIPILVTITLLCGIAYVSVQQVLRMGANDPQIQMSEDAASALAGGAAVESVVPASRTDIGSGLAPYLVVYDDAGKPVAASGLLHNQMPALPTGVLDHVRQVEQDRITWQPEPGVRSAIVVTRYQGARPGFVMAGRSLREVENRESQELAMIALGWAGTCIAALVAIALGEFISPRRSA